jgi:hypothetical protein
VQKKIIILVILAVLGVAGFFGWKFLSFHVLFEMRLQEVFEKKVTRFPSVEQLKALPDSVKEAAREAHVNDEGMTTTLKLQGRQMGPVVMWFLIARIEDSSGRVMVHEQQMENAGGYIDDPDKCNECKITIVK